jgi:predicted acetyltransferase
MNLCSSPPEIAITENGVIVGAYSLHNNSLFSINIHKEHRRQGIATRFISKLLSDGVIKGPSEIILSRHIVSIYKKLGYDVSVGEADLTDIIP